MINGQHDIAAADHTDKTAVAEHIAVPLEDHILQRKIGCRCNVEGTRTRCRCDRHRIGAVHNDRIGKCRLNGKSRFQRNGCHIRRKGDIVIRFAANRDGQRTGSILTRIHQCFTQTDLVVGGVLHIQTGGDDQTGQFSIVFLLNGTDTGQVAVIRTELIHCQFFRCSGSIAHNQMLIGIFHGGVGHKHVLPVCTVADFHTLTVGKTAVFVGLEFKISLSGGFIHTCHRGAVGRHGFEDVCHFHIASQGVDQRFRTGRIDVIRSTRRRVSGNDTVDDINIVRYRQRGNGSAGCFSRIADCRTGDHVERGAFIRGAVNTAVGTGTVAGKGAVCQRKDLFSCDRDHAGGSSGTVVDKTAAVHPDIRTGTENSTP